MPKTALVRFVVSPDGLMTPDLAEKLPGRGYWVSSDHQSLEEVVQKKLFARAVGKSVKIPEDLAANVETGLITRLSGLIALARKSGGAVGGFEKVQEAILAKRVGLLLHAIDGSQRQRAKLSRLLELPETCICLTATELGLAFGRDSVIHAAIFKGALAAKISRESMRLTKLRGISRPQHKPLSLEPAMT